MHRYPNQPNKKNIGIHRIWICREPSVDMKDKLNKDSPQTTPSLPRPNLCVPQHTGQSSLFWRFVYICLFTTQILNANNTL